MTDTGHEMDKEIMRDKMTPDRMRLLGLIERDLLVSEDWMLRCMTDYEEEGPRLVEVHPTWEQMGVYAQGYADAIKHVVAFLRECAEDCIPADGTELHIADNARREAFEGQANWLEEGHYFADIAKKSEED